MSVEAWLWTSCALLACAVVVCAVGWFEARTMMQYYRARSVAAEAHLEGIAQLDRVIVSALEEAANKPTGPIPVRH